MNNRCSTDNGNSRNSNFNSNDGSNMGTKRLKFDNNFDGFYNNENSHYNNNMPSTSGNRNDCNNYGDNEGPCRSNEQRYENWQQFSNAGSQNNKRRFDSPCSMNDRGGGDDSNNGISNNGSNSSNFNDRRNQQDNHTFQNQLNNFDCSLQHNGNLRNQSNINIGHSTFNNRNNEGNLYNCNNGLDGNSAISNHRQFNNGHQEFQQNCDHSNFCGHRIKFECNQPNFDNTQSLSSANYSCNGCNTNFRRYNSSNCNENRMSCQNDNRMINFNGNRCGSGNGSNHHYNDGHMCGKRFKFDNGFDGFHNCNNLSNCNNMMPSNNNFSYFQQQSFEQILSTPNFASTRFDESNGEFQFANSFTLARSFDENQMFSSRNRNSQRRYNAKSIVYTKTECRSTNKNDRSMNSYRRKTLPKYLTSAKNPRRNIMKKAAGFESPKIKKQSPETASATVIIDEQDQNVSLKSDKDECKININWNNGEQYINSKPITDEEFKTAFEDILVICENIGYTQTEVMIIQESSRLCKLTTNILKIYSKNRYLIFLNDLLVANGASPANACAIALKRIRKYCYTLQYNFKSYSNFEKITVDSKKLATKSLSDAEGIKAESEWRVENYNWATVKQIIDEYLATNDLMDLEFDYRFSKEQCNQIKAYVIGLNRKDIECKNGIRSDIGRYLYLSRYNSMPNIVKLIRDENHIGYSAKYQLIEPKLNDDDTSSTNKNIVKPKSSFVPTINLLKKGDKLRELGLILFNIVGQKPISTLKMSCRMNGYKFDMKGPKKYQTITINDVPICKGITKKLQKKAISLLSRYCCTITFDKHVLPEPDCIITRSKLDKYKDIDLTENGTLLEKWPKDRKKTKAEGVTLSNLLARKVLLDHKDCIVFAFSNEFTFMEKSIIHRECIRLNWVNCRTKIPKKLQYIIVLPYTNCADLEKLIKDNKDEQVTKRLKIIPPTFPEIAIKNDSSSSGVSKDELVSSQTVASSGDENSGSSDVSFFLNKSIDLKSIIGIKDKAIAVADMCDRVMINEHNDVAEWVAAIENESEAIIREVKELYEI